MDRNHDGGREPGSDDLELRLQRLVEQTPVGLFEATADGRCVFVSQRFCDIVGWEREKILGDEWRSIVHPDDLDDLVVAWTAAARERRAMELPVRYITSDGGVVHAWGSISPIFDDDDRLCGFGGSIADDTVRLQLIRERETATQQFEAVFKLAPTGTAVTEYPTGASGPAQIVEVNDAYLKMTQRTLEETIGLNAQEVVHEDFRDEAVLGRRQLIDGDIESHQMDLRMLCGDGRFHWFSLRRAVIFDSDGTVHRSVSQLEPLDGRKAVEAEKDRLAGTDSLTGLANRRLFDARIDELANRVDRHRVAVVYVDLDMFKRVNDTAGHSAGDDVLIEMADILKLSTRRDDFVARWGGDEFAIVVDDADDAGLDELVARLRDLMTVTVTFDDGSSHTVTASIGVAVSETGADVAALTASADAAMYEAKRAGRHRVRFARVGDEPGA